MVIAHHVLAFWSHCIDIDQATALRSLDLVITRLTENQGALSVRWKTSGGITTLGRRPR
jgi:hypothetical protein